MRPAVLFLCPPTAELSRLLVLAGPLMDFQSQQRPKPLSGLLEQNAFHTDAEVLLLAQSFLPAVVSDLWTSFLAAQHMWAHADVHIMSANDRMHQILILTCYLLLCHYQKWSRWTQPAWTLFKKSFFPPIFLFLMQQITAFLKKKKCKLAAAFMCFWVFNLEKKLFLSIKIHIFHPHFKVMLKGVNDSEGFRPWLYNKASKKKSSIIFIPLQYPLLHYSWSYLSRRR